MDLIYCSDPSLAGEITGVLAEQPTAKPVTHKATGPWGAFVATDTPYWGYAPSVVDNDLFCILGDPLTSKVPVRGHGGAERTLGVARKWTADPSSVEPDHPAALIRARASRSSIRAASPRSPTST